MGLTIDDTKNSSGVVYVNDSRKEIGEIENPQALANTQSNIALIDIQNIQEEGDSIVVAGVKEFSKLLISQISSKNFNRR